MSPAAVNRFRWSARVPRLRQVGRSLHFLLLVAYALFVVAHVTMVVLTGFVRNMNHIVVGTDDPTRFGMYIGLTGLVILFLINVMANWASWLFPRTVQRIGDAIVNPVMRAVLPHRAAPRAEYRPEEISPFLWPNGKLPTCDQWKALAADGFQGYRLRVGGLVENPVELSLEQIRSMGKRTQVTLHHCIQGWSGIAEWGGLTLPDLIALVHPKPNARAVIIYSFAEGTEGGEYYDTQPIENARHPRPSSPTR
jgi:sulfoxide reductase catalytic subunit YedY